MALLTTFSPFTFLNSDICYWQLWRTLGIMNSVGVIHYWPPKPISNNVMSSRQQLSTLSVIAIWSHRLSLPFSCPYLLHTPDTLNQHLILCSCWKARPKLFPFPWLGYRPEAGENTVMLQALLSLSWYRYIAPMPALGHLYHFSRKQFSRDKP